MIKKYSIISLPFTLSTDKAACNAINRTGYGLGQVIEKNDNSGKIYCAVNYVDVG